MKVDCSVKLNANYPVEYTVDGDELLPSDTKIIEQSAGKVYKILNIKEDNPDEQFGIIYEVGQLNEIPVVFAYRLEIDPAYMNVCNICEERFKCFCE